MLGGTDPHRAQVIYLILWPGRGHLPIVYVLAKHNGLAQTGGGSTAQVMQTMFKKKAIQSGDRNSEDEFTNKSREVMGNLVGTRGSGLCCPRPGLSQPMFEVVPVLCQRLPHPRAHP